MAIKVTLHESDFLMFSDSFSSIKHRYTGCAEKKQFFRKTSVFQQW